MTSNPPITTAATPATYGVQTRLSTATARLGTPVATSIPAAASSSSAADRQQRLHKGQVASQRSATAPPAQSTPGNNPKKRGITTSERALRNKRYLDQHWGKNGYLPPPQFIRDRDAGKTLNLNSIQLSYMKTITQTCLIYGQRLQPLWEEGGELLEAMVRTSGDSRPLWSSNVPKIALDIMKKRDPGSHTSESPSLELGQSSSMVNTTTEDDDTLMEDNPFMEEDTIVEDKPVVGDTTPVEKQIDQPPHQNQHPSPYIQEPPISPLLRSKIPITEQEAIAELASIRQEYMTNDVTKTAHSLQSELEALRCRAVQHNRRRILVLDRLLQTDPEAAARLRGDKQNHLPRPWIHWTEEQLTQVLLSDDGAATPAGLRSLTGGPTNGEPEATDADVMASSPTLSDFFSYNPAKYAAATPAGLLSLTGPPAHGEPEATEVDVMLSLQKLSDFFRTNPAQYTMESLQSELARHKESEEDIATGMKRAQEAAESDQELLRKAKKRLAKRQKALTQFTSTLDGVRRASNPAPLDSDCDSDTDSATRLSSLQSHHTTLRSLEAQLEVDRAGLVKAIEEANTLLDEILGSINAGMGAMAALEETKARLDEKGAELQGQLPLYTVIDGLIKNMVPAPADPTAPRAKGVEA
ncbi:hypothetical protein CONLIGDRAFT_686670 [Coniochaeta ligniaria NRRL 30616]|uniref:Uncharacterized protein n=1 Tax=Coniochaeta ligniaria NRRL 30616 TaxID=1408157 RepID=A0A1J7I6G3_9PEZI|nr:hypothetical protein CONLIGDRAFT_686670 [Coniochaeta ligniaria NRRL 30616]